MKCSIKVAVSAVILSFLLCAISVSADPYEREGVIDNVTDEFEEQHRVAGVCASLFSMLGQDSTPSVQPNDISMIQLPNGYSEVVPASVGHSSTVDSDFESYDCYCAVNALNIRLAPTKDSDSIGKYLFGNKLTIVAEIGNWGLTDRGWVCLDYILQDLGARIVDCPPTSGWKSYEYYTALRAYKQADLQERAFTDSEGFRKVDGRYCVAVGTRVSSSVGTYFDIVLKNGTVINCIVGDVKDDADTQSNNIITAHNGCASEFIVSRSLRSDLRCLGDVSTRVSEWDSPVDYFIVYDYNVFD